MEEEDNCAHCGERLKVGAFSSNQLLAKRKVDVINHVEGTTRTHACDKCGTQAYEKASRKVASELTRLQENISAGLSLIPILSIHSPPGWTYRPLEIITAQTVTGTGFFAEFTSAWTDAFGAQSNAFTKKLRAGEDLCKASLRLQALRLGGNAIVASDVDYGEVGGVKAMLMVCMTGTAVVVADECLDAVARPQREMLAAAIKTHAALQKFGIAPEM
ncbi:MULTISPECIES: heavy metal-binding domain-containing protein [unclassified Sphingomonas]|uniref:heavy metal-binding domain-containing protein n=1 Tax=unclassified Sphingomonas TaxID=196159 RepID=UPI0006FD3F37|nr:MULTISPECIES: heavy metal-binding domain-containing protein [unclassified Sphingomonas]KQX20694.1 hypothetical protein ASD17_07260 [Sphingomonas sp. Root1294]KQY68539.1 hypothetical protein ASD39_03780 [Sphingomonas sp. Root50]KRB87945.1 hypothetical protein ASE22_20955 [Sphingomonas sp. Root720]